MGANKKLWLSQSKHVNFASHHFCVEDCKPLSVLISMGTEISTKHCCTTLTEMEDTIFVPYASVVGSLMYGMVCTKPDIAQVVGVSCRFMANPWILGIFYP